MPTSLPPPWQYRIYRPAMALVGQLYPAIKRLRQPSPPYPARYDALRGRWPADIRAIGASATRGTIWVHGVSVGEILATAPFVRLWQSEGPPDVPVIVTTTTNGGMTLAKKALPATTPLAFFPFDSPSAIRAAFETFHPAVLVLYETELWPTLLFEAQRRGIPTLLANARISDRTANPPALARPLIAWMLQTLTNIIPQSDLDARRLRTFGVRDDQLLPVGNVKFDAAGEPPTEEARLAARTALGIGASQPVFVAGSTHPGEEEMVLDAVTQVRLARKDLLLILAPRHLERLAQVKGILEAANMPFRLLSDLQQQGPGLDDPPTIVVDTLGDLMSLYGLADCAFVGGSLIPRGGHNILEPAAQGCPVLHGPSMENFRSLVEILTYAQVAQLVTRESLAHHLREIVGDAYSRGLWRERALAVVNEGRGTSKRIVEWVKAALE
ncbi:MAG: glycosyltransferase N-terminal domain-containing protein [bacterium]